MRVAVVGAGLGGLSAACHLLGAGHDVTVLERAATPGGRAGQWRSEGYCIDTGPTVLTMPDLLEATFAAAGARLEDYVQLTPLDPLYRATFSDAPPIVVRRGRQAMTEEIREKCSPSDAAAFGLFCEWLQRLYDVEQPNFIDRNYDSILDLARPLRPAIQLLHLGAFKKLSAVVATYFSDARLQKLFSFQSLYAGLSPYDALALYGIITYMDTVSGVWFPAGGIHSIAAGLSKALEEGGAAMRYEAGVAEVLRRHGHSGPVCGIRLESGEELLADAVVVNADVAGAYDRLLPGVAAPRVARRGEYSPSATLWLAGVTGSPPPGAAHHNLHFGGDWRGSFDALLRHGTRQPDPSILVSMPSLTDASLAPSGGHVIYALEPVPNLDGHIDWAREREPARQSLIERLRTLGYPVGDVVIEQFVDPTDWQAQGMARGTPFALSHRFLQSGPWRPANRDRRVPGLVLVGSSTVPGVGVPMVLVSGRLAALRVQELERGR